MDLTSAAMALADVMRLAYLRGTTTGGGGNASYKVEEGVLITPSGLFKANLDPEDMVLIDHEGIVIRGKHRPSSEWRMHLAIYERRRDVRSVLHCHHPLVTGMANLGLVPGKESWTEEAKILLKGLDLVDRAPYGSKKLARSVAEAFGSGHNAVVIRGHGPVVAGKDPWMALAAMDSLIEIYEIEWVKLVLGGDFY